ncbi:MAG: DUF2141 domain-containing protein [Rikenellaceae bacterium]
MKVLKLPIFLLFLCSGLQLSAQEANSDDGKLALSITNLNGNRGNLIVTYFDDAEAFSERDEEYYFRKDTISLHDLEDGVTNKVVYTTIKPGRYAVYVHHDEDGDGKMPKTLIKNPLEGEGFSNVTVHRYPKFRNAAIQVEKGVQSVALVQLFYPEVK